MAGVLVPASVCLESEALTLDEGKGVALTGGGGSGLKPRCQLLFLHPWALSKQNLCPRGQAGLKGAISLEPGGLAQPSTPSWLGDKASSKISHWSKPGRFGTTGPEARLPVTGGEWGKLPASSHSAQGQRGLLWEGGGSPPQGSLSFTGFIEPELGIEAGGTQALSRGRRRR